MSFVLRHDSSTCPKAAQIRRLRNLNKLPQVKPPKILNCKTFWTLPVGPLWGFWFGRREF